MLNRLFFNFRVSCLLQPMSFGY